MPRDWHPMRFFVRADGRRYPTILFWLFFMPVMIILLAGGCAVLNRRAEQTRVAAALTKTPTAAIRDTPVAATTSTPSTPVGEPTATEFVYDDPSGWEFVERTDPTGKKYLDLQDWQKEQVWHAFEEFWNLRYRSEDGITPFEQIAAHVSGRYLEGVQFDYDFASQNGEYVFLLQPVSDISRAMLLESAEGGEVRVKVVLVSDVGFPLERRDVQTGEVLQTNQRFPYKTWNFVLAFLDGRWVVEDSTAEELE